MTSPSLKLNKEHQYSLDGKPIDGLTATLKEAGLIRSSDEWYMTKGTAIHLATEYYDKGTLDEDILDPQIKPYLESWKRFRKDQNYTPFYIEKSLFDPIYLYAGTIDRLPLVDLKSGVKEKWHELQLAGYWNLCIVNGFFEQCKKPITIYLRKDGSSPEVISYSKKEMKDAFQAFLCFLHTARWKRRLH